MSGRRYFKFLHKEHIRYYEGDRLSLRFGRLRYYRMLESATGDGRIGDLNEGIQKHVIPHLVLDEKTSPTTRSILKTLRFTRGNCAGVTLNNCTIIDEIDCYVLCGSVCFSDQEIADCFLEFVAFGDSAYDALIEIIDMPALIRNLRSARIDGEPLTARYRVEAKKVTYKPVSSNDVLQSESIVSADAFRKDTKYEKQHEYRIAIYPKVPSFGWDWNLDSLGRRLYRPKDFIDITIDRHPVRIKQSEIQNSPRKKEDNCSIPDVLPFVRLASHMIEKHDPSRFDRRKEVSNEVEFQRDVQEVLSAYWPLRTHWPHEHLDTMLEIPSFRDTHFASNLRDYLARNGWITN